MSETGPTFQRLENIVAVQRALGRWLTMEREAPRVLAGVCSVLVRAGGFPLAAVVRESAAGRELTIDGEPRRVSAFRGAFDAGADVTSAGNAGSVVCSVSNDTSSRVTLVVETGDGAGVLGLERGWLGDVAEQLGAVLQSIAREETLRTELDRVSRQRAAIQEQFDRVSESVPGATFSFSMSPEGRFSVLYSSPGIESLLGVSRDELSQSLEHWLSKVEPKVALRSRDTLKQSSDSLQSWHEVFEYQHPTLGARVQEVWAIPHRSENGATSWDGFVMDITDRRRAEQALAASEEMYRWLFEHMSNGFSHCKVVYDGEKAVDWLYLKVNSAFSRLTELTNVEGKRFSELAPGLLESNQHLLDACTRVATSGHVEQIDLCVPVAEPSYQERWFSVTLYSAEPGHFVALFEGISERKRAELALTKSEARMRMIFEHAPVGMVQLDPISQRYVRVNRQFCEITGYTEQELLDGPAVIEHVSGEARCVRKDGSIRWLNVTVSRSEPGVELTHVLVAEDITAKREAEATLRLYTGALQAAANGIVITDNEGNVLSVNRAFTQLTGYQASEVLHDNPRILRSGLQDQAFYDELWGTITSGRVWRGELVNRRKDGSLYHEDMTITPVTNERGEPTHFVAIKQDISERKEAEDTLREAREHLQIALDAGEMGTWRQDVLSGVLSLDTRARELLDIDVPIVSGELMASRVHPDDIDPMLRLMMAIRKNGQEIRETVEHRVLRRDGTIRWVSNHVKVIFGLLNGQSLPMFAVGTIRDVSEAKAAEEALRASEERYRALVDNIDGVVYSTDLNGNITFVNRSIEKYGYSVENVVGRPRSDFIHPDDRPSAMAQRGVQISTGVYQPVDFRFVDANGGSRFMRATIRPLTVAGQMMGVTGVLVDITAQRETEEQLRAAQKMEAVGRLAGGVAHDFNNLLSVILSYTELAIVDLHKEDPLRIDLEEVVQAAKRAEGLTRQLLAFSRRQVLRLEAIDLGSTLLALGNMLRRLIGEDIELRLDIPEGLSPVVADRGQVEQVLMNLIVNARDAMPDGGQVSVVLRDCQVDMAAATKLDVPMGDYVEFSVTDTGCGMDAATLARIYEPFFTTKGLGQGTGLGLSMVYGIVRQSGGAISVESKVGNGTTFTILLPRALVSRAGEPEISRGVRRSRGHETLLMVEDETALRNLVHRVLTAAGYKVFSAANAGEALLLCEKHGRDIELVLTDVVMPGMNGKELAQRIAPLCPSARTIYMSGYTGEVLDRYGIDEPNFLAKPFDLHTLTQKIRDVLDRS